MRCWWVMPFGPRNAPAFHICVMRMFCGKWQALFCSCCPTDAAHLGSCVVIDDILLWATVLRSLLNLFECVCDVFMKHRVTFQSKKCEFLTDCIEHVGHDVTPDGNFPAKLTFDLINDSSLPADGQSLHSFIGLLTFYKTFTALSLKSKSSLFVLWSTSTTASPFLLLLDTISH
jgi:hypothetical protein